MLRVTNSGGLGVFLIGMSAPSSERQTHHRIQGA
jgi:hypothetical protein